MCESCLRPYPKPRKVSQICKYLDSSSLHMIGVLKKYLHRTCAKSTKPIIPRHVIKTISSYFEYIFMSFLIFNGCHLLYLDHSGKSPVYLYILVFIRTAFMNDSGFFVMRFFAEAVRPPQRYYLIVLIFSRRPSPHFFSYSE